MPWAILREAFSLLGQTYLGLRDQTRFALDYQDAGLIGPSPLDTSATPIHRVTESWSD